MTTIAHTISASYITYTFLLGFTPHELNISLLLASTLPAALLDLDHLYYAVRYPIQFKQWQKNLTLHHARSWLHEILGMTAIFTMCVLISVLINKLIAQAILLSYTIHLAQDMIMGTSTPLKGIDNHLIKLFNLSFKQKAVIDISTIIIFGALWLLLLKNLVG